MIRVQEVAPGSLSERLGLVPGTELLAVDGRALEDFLDWEFLTAEDRFILQMRSPDGRERALAVERPEGHSMGVRLEPPRIRRCANHSDFCFVDGNPNHLRPSLFIRDDDYRLSFRYGNFATLTNLKPWDVDRIIEYRLSPLYVSVHATDSVIRRWLLRNPEAPEIVPQLGELAEQGIRFHTQVVLVPGVNDGDVLTRTLDDLYGMGKAAVLSVSVVPVALTEFSQWHLVRQATQQECRDALQRVAARAQRSMVERGEPWCYGADDLYLQAGIPLPPAAWYGEFDQRENGVGAVRYLQTRIASVPASGRFRGQRIAVLTGRAMEPLMPQVLADLRQATGAEFEILGLENRLFGQTVTTAGLLPGEAFRAALAGRGDLDLALLPAEAVNDDGLFMDGIHVDALAGELPVRARLSVDFVDVLGEAE